MILTHFDAWAKLTITWNWPLTLPAVIEKVWLAAPAGMVTLEGTSRPALLLVETANVRLAAADRFVVTVQVLLAPPARLVGLQLRLDSASAANSVTVVACELLPSVAVTTAVSVFFIVSTVGVKVALVAPLATFTDGGTVRYELLALSITVVTPGAA